MESHSTERIVAGLNRFYGNLKFHSQQYLYFFFSCMGMLQLTFSAVFYLLDKTELISIKIRFYSLSNVKFSSGVDCCLGLDGILLRHLKKTASCMFQLVNIPHDKPRSPSRK